MNIILHIIIGVAISITGISFIFGFLDELSNSKPSLDFKYVKEGKNYANKLRLLPRIIFLIIIYIIEISYYIGVNFIKIIKFLLLK